MFIDEGGGRRSDEGLWAEILDESEMPTEADRRGLPLESTVEPEDQA